ncbi:MAG: hypothetical protein U0457_03555 [Candidatus Sericytochromatia bacterium]
MRKFTALFNLGTTFVLLGALYTGMDTYNHKTDPTLHSLTAFLTFVVVAACIANAMLYINTLHREIDELKTKLDKKDN